MPAQDKKKATGVFFLMACVVLILAFAVNGEAYNITQGKISDPNGILWKEISDGSNSKGTCATNPACHANADNGRKGKIKNSQLLEGNKKFNSYIGGKTYALTINVPAQAGTMNGFQMSARDSNRNSAGTFKIGSKCQVYDTIDSDTNKAVGLIESVHNINNVSSWRFNWTAPHEGTGKVVFYYSITSGNGIWAEDSVYYGSVSVSEQ